jgi:hypothetical protein
MRALGQAVGRVENFDPMTGTASVRLSESSPEVAAAAQDTACLHIGAFFSGRTARPPVDGDQVRVLLQQSADGLLVIAARLIEPPPR